MGCMVDQERYSAPMPWIGLYIAAASAACSIAMLVDYVQGIRHRKVWLPCKLFSLNATSLTLLAIATKLPVDLSTPMPRAQEQLAKLSGTSLICITMGHFMPSIGAMEDSQVILNVVPLVIIVITVIVNMCIQMGTGVIHAFIPEHIITLCFMVMMLLISCSSALAIPTMKGLLKLQLELNCQEVQHKRQPNEPAMSTVENLKKDIRKYLIMALTSNPQYVLSRSSLGVAAGFFCSFQAGVLMEAFVRMLKRGSVPVCTNQSSSDYKWSIPLIVFSQTFAVVVGAFAPSIRMLTDDFRNASGIRIKESQGHQNQQSVEREEQAASNHQNKLKVERYWIQKFVEWRDRPLLVLDIRSRSCRRFLHGSNYLIVEAMRRVHIAVVLFCKLMDLNRALDLPPGAFKDYRPEEYIFILVKRIAQSIDRMRFMLVREIYHAIEKMGAMLQTMIAHATEEMEPTVASRSKQESRTERAPSFAAIETELRPFVLHLKNEGGLVDRIMRSCDVTVERCIQKRSRQPIANLTNLLTQSSDGSPSFAVRAQSNTTNHAQEPSNCWALPLVTLTSIALALPCTRGDQMKQLLRDGVNEGLTYVRHVDNSLDAQGDLMKVREAANVAWQGVDLYNQWLDLDLAAFASEGKDPKDVIEQLANKGSGYEAEVESLVKGRGDMKSGLRWPPRALALYSMANICKSILSAHSNFSIDDADGLFKQLHVMISDMLGSCLADLPRALYMQCHKSSMEAGDDEVMDAAHLLREAENILKTISREGLGINQRKYVEYWRSFMPNWSDLPSISPIRASSMAV